MKKINANLVIIGGGAAGVGAAIAASDAGLTDIILVEKAKELGGILNQCIHDGFGLHAFKKELTGPEYAHELTKLLKDKSVTLWLNATVTNVSNNKEITVYKEGEGILLINTKALILTTGSYERSAGAINLPGERSAGIFTAGQAQLLINERGLGIGKRVFIIGSGDIGLIMARRLTLTGSKVLGVAEIMPYSSGLKRNIVQCLEDFNIPLFLSHKVKEVRGKPRVQEVDIFATDEQGNEVPGSLKTFAIDTLLLAVGLIPYVTLAENLNLPLSKTKGPLVNSNYQTAAPWFFAAGNALHIHDLADDAYFEGREAGSAASMYVNNALITKQKINVEAGKNVNYLIPSFVSIPLPKEELLLKLRVSQPLLNHKIKVFIDEELIYQKFYPFLFPSELTIVKLKRELIKEGRVLKVEVNNE